MSVDEAIEALFARDAAAQAAGLELVDYAPGRARVALTVGPEQVNGQQTTHGAVIFLLADVAFGMACNGYGRATVGRSAQIEYLAPSVLGDRLEARADERMRAGRNGIYDVAVTRAADGVLVAEFRGNARELPPSPP